MVIDHQDGLRMHTIQQVLANLISNQEAAHTLDLSVRSIQRLKRKASEQGIEAVLHGNRGRTPHNAIPMETIQRILELAKKELKGLNFTHMQEILLEHYQIHISRSSLQSLLNREGISSPKKHRKTRTIHRVRDRRKRQGELIQADASQHDWFSTGQKVHLHGMIDDATSQIVGLHFAQEETLEAYTECMQQMNQKHGLPLAIYTDGRTVFHYGPKEEQDIQLEEQLAGIQFK